MAKNKSPKYPHQWPDGSWHSVTWAQHQQNQAHEQRYGGMPAGQAIAQYGQDYAAGLTPAANGTVGQFAGTAPTTMPQPPDPAAEAASRQAIWNTGVASAEAGWQGLQTTHELGYDAGGNLNTSNPYSQAQLLQDNYKRSITGTNNQMAAGGQLYSGARLNAQGRNDRLYAEGSSALRDQAARAHHGIGFGQLTAYGQNMTGVTEAQGAGLMSSIYRSP